jgi:hypothetical protein
MLALAATSAPPAAATTAAFPMFVGAVPARGGSSGFRGCKCAGGDGARLSGLRFRSRRFARRARRRRLRLSFPRLASLAALDIPPSGCRLRTLRFDRALGLGTTRTFAATSIAAIAFRTTLIATLPMIASRIAARACFARAVARGRRAALARALG